MRSAKMRHRLRILRKDSAKDEFRSFRTEWTETATVWAERVRITPRYGMEADEIFSDFTAEFNIRAYHEVRDGWRVEGSDGNLYTVTNVTPNIARGMKTLRCEKVNQ